MTASPPLTDTNAPQDAEAKGFPLSAMFLLTAFCCVLAALAMSFVRSVITKELSLESTLVASTVAAVVGMLLGALLGLAQRGPLAGMFIGGPTGFVLGMIVGPLCLVPVERLSSIIGVSIGGSVLLIVIAVVIRIISAKSVSQEPNEKT